MGKQIGNGENLLNPLNTGPSENTPLSGKIRNNTSFASKSILSAKYSILDLDIIFA